jgi:hypothetical protein
VQDNSLTLWSHAVMARKTDHNKSCNLLSLEWELEPRLDGPNENAHFTPPSNFFILHNTCKNNRQQKVPSTLGVSVSISQTGGREQRVVQRDCKQ